MLVRDLEPYLYLLPIRELNGSPVVLCSKALGYYVVPKKRGLQTACRFWNKHIRRYSSLISPMPDAHFTGDIVDGLLYLHWHPTSPNDPLPRELVLNPFTGFMCEPFALKDPEMFSGRLDALSTLWNLHCGFGQRGTVKNLAKENPLPMFYERDKTLRVHVPTRDLTYLDMSMKEFMTNCGVFADYFSVHIEERMEKDEVVGDSSNVVG